MLFPSELAPHITPRLALAELLRVEAQTYRLAVVSDAAIEVAARDPHVVDAAGTVTLIAFLCREFWLGVVGREKTSRRLRIL